MVASRRAREGEGGSGAQLALPVQSLISGRDENMQKRIVYTLILIVSLLRVGCAPEPTVVPTPTPDPQAVAARAGTAMQTVQWLHFVLEGDGSPAYIDAEETLVFRRAEGDYVAPDRLQASVKVMAAGLVAEIQVITVQKKRWMTNLLTGQWEELPAGWELSPSALFDAEVGIPHLMTQGLVAARTQVEGPAEFDDLDGAFWYLTSETTGDQVHAMSGGLIPSGPAQLEAWIDPTTYLIHRIRLVLPESDPEQPMELTIEFSLFDEPLDIQPPK